MRKIRYKLKDYVDLSYLAKIGFVKNYVDFSKNEFSKSNDIICFYDLKDENNFTVMSIRAKDREICIHLNEKMLFKMIKDGMVEEYIWEKEREKWQKEGD